MARKFALLGTLLAGISIVLGAFGAHALKQFLPMDSLAIFETGVRYQLIHSLALIILSHAIAKDETTTSLRNVGQLFCIGILLFSGSLYGLALQPLTMVSYKMILGPVTPLGGLCFISGWGLWGYHIYRSK
ncbi:MAG: DUF423 domain-containing protein [Chitinophagia bacterium]|jgi:uncharacterized membrane protein YgdD (TMEM256/DUF423 family)|nr:DUF423 domain-containing protein [Chitinophagia bacterium]